jgi:GGDEF domain-containing protein
MTNEDMGLILQNLMQSKGIDLLVLKNNKVRHINKNFKNYLNKLGIEASHKTLFDIGKNYNQNFENFKKFSFLKPLIEKYNEFNLDEKKEEIYFSTNLDNLNIKIDYNGFILNKEKYNIFTLTTHTDEIKSINNKFYNISKEINEISFKKISRSNFNSYDIFNKIFSILQDEMMLDAFIIAAKEKNEIKVIYGKIKNNDVSGIYLPNSSLTGYICSIKQNIYIKNSLNIKIPEKYKIIHISEPEIYSVFGIYFDDDDFSNGAILFERKGQDSFINHELKILEELSYTIKSILKYAKLYEKLKKEKEKFYSISIRDKLTKAYNRVFLEEYLTKTLNNIKRYEKKSILIFIDIDGFKTINDTFGHNYGDTCLVFFAETVFSNIRSSDVFARYGGDEFIIVLNETTMKTAKKKSKTFAKRTVQFAF